MTTRSVARLVGAAALASALILPGTVVAADPAPQAPSAYFQAWQEQLAQMRATGSNLSAHVTDCIAMHGSTAGMLGPNGTVAGRTSGMMPGTTRS
jgi:hypothetical protein